MMIVQSKRFFKYFTNKWVQGIALFPFILYKDTALRKNKRFINHERIHIRQQMEMLVLLFYIWYFTEYLIRLMQYGGDGKLAYRNISFEREAYSNENDLNYLKKRRFWSFLEYL